MNRHLSLLMTPITLTDATFIQVADSAPQTHASTMVCVRTAFAATPAPARMPMKDRTVISLKMSVNTKLERDVNTSAIQDLGPTAAHVQKAMNLGKIKNHAFQEVLLLNSEGKGFCGGVLLKSNFVLTTAECALLHNHSGITVRTGNNRMHGAGQVIDVNEKHIHMRYDEATGENNLALLQLGEHIECSNYHHPICLPDKDFAEHVLIPQLAGTVSGWKLEESEVRGSPVELQVSYLPERECEQILNTSLTNRQYCGHHPEPVDGQLAGGNFIAHDYKGTWFLTGIFGAWPTNVIPQKQNPFSFQRQD
ncbi:ubiquitin-conjugating enzyme E2 variant 3 [Platysternon megacephalum]|uniref:Ubiquitin-conjugating enzyme E2 variant 3 n=1 Tax=Platysternon megacephalum TaxID=55544 RepID=A0A4D9ET86_9SAUR|nr:ubiquitin-conjugating enzyme E2 variant 3 [Platysternon megacephalum]